jgi:hypothetical protein
MWSGIVSVFPFGRAIQSPASRMPLFYVSHTAAALDGSEPDAQRVHLVRAASKHDARVVQITSGWFVFSFHPGYTAREEIPLGFHVLSSAVYTIQPESPLDNGEYLVIFDYPHRAGLNSRSRVRAVIATDDRNLLSTLAFRP